MSRAKSKFVESKKRGRPSMEFEEASDRIKRRKATDLRNSRSISELLLIIEMSLRSSGAFIAASIIKEITSTTPTRADKYRTALKLSTILAIIEMSDDAALSDVVEGKLSKNQYLLIRNSMKKHNALIYPTYGILKAKVRYYPRDVQVTETHAEVSVQALLNHT
ncbi:uncharacterized protein LOC105429899 isoform X1 [Pogonomyrmex barbatus]|uniref:Uncharacterized protein LOC105429899 isoform X1 n=1 Tax=Pogonomyrmex barbatus TaxID=144034 RepID=A0A6I9X9T0_9HYME|nr:uncharacterized protein LOC105429899 isoform X1 [Pogonomyrmex barbatus]